MGISRFVIQDLALPKVYDIGHLVIVLVAPGEYESQDWSPGASYSADPDMTAWLASRS